MTQRQWGSWSVSVPQAASNAATTTSQGIRDLLSRKSHENVTTQAPAEASGLNVQQRDDIDREPQAGKKIMSSYVACRENGKSRSVDAHDDLRVIVNGSQKPLPGNRQKTEQRATDQKIHSSQSDALDRSSGLFRHGRTSLGWPPSYARTWNTSKMLLLNSWRGVRATFSQEITKPSIFGLFDGGMPVPPSAYRRSERANTRILRTSSNHRQPFSSPKKVREALIRSISLRQNVNTLLPPHSLSPMRRCSSLPGDTGFASSNNASYLLRRGRKSPSRNCRGDDVAEGLVVVDGRITADDMVTTEGAIVMDGVVSAGDADNKSLLSRRFHIPRYIPFLPLECGADLDDDFIPENMHVNIWELCFYAVGVFAFFADFVSDIMLIMKYYSTGDRWLFSLTILCVVLPNITLSLFGLTWRINEITPDTIGDSAGYVQDNLCATHDEYNESDIIQAQPAYVHQNTVRHVPYQRLIHTGFDEIDGPTRNISKQQHGIDPFGRHTHKTWINQHSSHEVPASAHDDWDSPLKTVVEQAHHTWDKCFKIDGRPTQRSGEDHSIFNMTKPRDGQTFDKQCAVVYDDTCGGHMLDSRLQVVPAGVRVCQNQSQCPVNDVTGALANSISDKYSRQADMNPFETWDLNSESEDNDVLACPYGSAISNSNISVSQACCNGTATTHIGSDADPPKTRDLSTVEHFHVNTRTHQTMKPCCDDDGFDILTYQNHGMSSNVSLVDASSKQPRHNNTEVDQSDGNLSRDWNANHSGTHGTGVDQVDGYLCRDWNAHHPGTHGTGVDQADGNLSCDWNANHSGTHGTGVDQADGYLRRDWNAHRRGYTKVRVDQADGYVRRDWNIVSSSDTCDNSRNKPWRRRHHSWDMAEESLREFTINDGRTEMLEARAKVAMRSGWSVWAVRIIVLVFQLDLCIKYLRALMCAYRGYMHGRLKQRKLEKYYISKQLHLDADIALLRVFDVFMDSGSQVVLQLYVVCKALNSGTPFCSMNVSFQRGFSIISSLISLGYALAGYNRCLRRTQLTQKRSCWPSGHPQPIPVPLMCTALNFIWCVILIATRVVAISVLASASRLWFATFLFTHWAITFVIIMNLQTDFYNRRQGSNGSISFLTKDPATCLNASRHRNLSRRRQVRNAKNQFDSDQAVHEEHMNDHTSMMENDAKFKASRQRKRFVFFELFYNFACSYVYIFSFINLKDGRTRFRHLIYYSVFYLENILLAVFYYRVQTTVSKQIRICIVVFILIGFWFAMVVKVVYYFGFHPSPHVRDQLRTEFKLPNLWGMLMSKRKKAPCPSCWFDETDDSTTRQCTRQQQRDPVVDDDDSPVATNCQNSGRQVYSDVDICGVTGTCSRNRDDSNFRNANGVLIPAALFCQESVAISSSSDQQQNIRGE